MNKFVQWSCAAAWSIASFTPAMANSDTHDQKYPPVEVKDAPLEYRQFEKVEITGSAILAKEAKEALPVQVITQREIERSGSTNLAELLQQLPLMNNFAENGTLPTSDGGPQSAAIHGYASGTLVLLNGRRLPYYGNNSIAGERAFVDLNILPLSAIERIELLTDGASTRYGSDAMAGVVNIITKSSVQGTTLSTQLTRPAGGRAPGEQFNLSWGKGKTEIDEHRVIREYTGGVILSANRKALQNSGFTLEELSQDYRQLSPSTWAKFSPYLQKDNFLLDDANTHLNALDLPNGVIPLNWAESV